MTENAELAHLVDGLSGARVLCIGDAMLDRFIYGQVDRISPEAPIPILRIDRELAMLGGAGNVVRNLVGLGAEAEFLSVVGDDAAGRELTALVGALPGVEPHLLVEQRRQTTIKSRYVAGTQQLLRADRETVEAVRPATLDMVVGLATAAVEDCGAIILSDYAKGLLSDAAIASLIATARKARLPVVVDPKGVDYARYRGATVLTPNRRELGEATRMPLDSPAAIEAAARRVIETCGVEAVLVTLGAEGMMLVAVDAAPAAMTAVAREVFDVSGAGDTVVATVAAALAAGLDLPRAARLANAAAGVVVGKVGTAAVRAEELIRALMERDLVTGVDKVATLHALQDEVERWRRQGVKVGFTNGCFDLLHPGHVSLLAQARAACDRLIVGLNSDESVRRLKGADRPVQGEAARAQILASLETVDRVVIFPEDTPLALIEALRPDVLVKGADYTVETVVGADLVQRWGGRVVLAELSAGFSTSATIRRMGRAKRGKTAAS